MKVRLLVALASSLLPLWGLAQEDPRVRNPEFLEVYAQTNRFRLGQPTGIRVAPKGDAVLFLRATGPRSFVQDLWSFDVATGKESILLTAEKLLGGGEEKLTPEELARRERARSASRGIAGYDLSDDGTRVLVPLSGRLFVVDRASAAAGAPKVTELKSEVGPAIDARFSPDAARVACVRGGALYVMDVASGAEKRLSPEAEGTVTWGEAEFVAQEEMSRSHGYWWSPDGQRMAFQRTDVEGVETFHIQDPADPAKPAQTWPYPRTGKKNADVTLWVKPVVIAPPGSASEDVQSVEVRWDRAKFAYLAKVVWKKEGPLTILVQNRTQTEQVLFAVDEKTGETRELLREQDETWINIDDSTPRWLKDGSGFLWVSEQGSSDGAELQVRGTDGALKHRIADQRDGVRSLIAQRDGVAYFSGGADPTQSHVFSVGLAAGAPVRDQTGSADARRAGSHGFQFADEAETLLHSQNLLDGTLRWSVSAGGKAVGELQSVAEPPPLRASPEIVAGVGPQRCYAVIVRPRDFDANRKYPVIDFVYGGPGANQVSATGRGYILHQWYADQGFIVVSIDGRGTPRRGRAWERVIKNNLIDIPLEDQCDAMLALCDKYPEMDRDRIGITGWSFGGYFSAMAAMRRPDVFKCGIAGAPVTDWADYDTHYTERFMGLPDENKAGYEASNVLTYCKDLTVPLMIVHGTADDNVYFVHSLKMTDALFKAGKKFDFVPLAGFTHAVNKPEAVRRLQSRNVSFFLDNLGGAVEGTASSR